jgi:hypothetical protein
MRNRRLHAGPERGTDGAFLPDHLSELAAALQRLARGVSVKVAALFQTGVTCFRAPSR